MLSGTSYYRLKQLDKDGQFAFSKILSTTSDMRNASIRLFPVPLKEQLTVVVIATAEKQALLYIRDATGKLVKKQILVLTEGSNTIQVPVAQLSHGIYTIQLIAGEKIYIDKIIK